MNKKILAATGLAALLMITGCSKQPSLENATETGQTAQTTQTTQTAQTTQTTGEATVTTTENDETVNTQNAVVEEQTISEGTKVSVSADQKFAKDLADVVIYFDFDKYNIKASEWPKVEKLAELIKNNPVNYTVRIEGNCDEWGTEEYNYALGLKRANAVKNALIKLGVDPKKLTIISYGELNPVCTAHAKWCWKKNRRDNFTYLP
jgi:peptidoglycan-associated lipoprotein